MLRDLTSNLEIAESVRPAVHTVSVDGEIVDLRGADSAAIAVTVGAIVGGAGDAQIILEESDTTTPGDFTAVADADLQGSEPTALTANTAYQFGYIGTKRYIRVTLDVGAETSVAGAGAVIKGHLHRCPNGASFAS